MDIKTPIAMIDGKAVSPRIGGKPVYMRNFFINANPEIIGYRDPDNDPPEEVLPLLEGPTGYKYLPIKDGIQAVGKVHVVDEEYITRDNEWDILPHSPEIAINKDTGVVSVLSTITRDFIVRLKAKYNSVYAEVFKSDDAKDPYYMQWSLRRTRAWGRGHLTLGDPTPNLALFHMSEFPDSQEHIYNLSAEEVTRPVTGSAQADILEFVKEARITEPRALVPLNEIAGGLEVYTALGTYNLAMARTGSGSAARPLDRAYTIASQGSLVYSSLTMLRVNPTIRLITGTFTGPWTISIESTLTISVSIFRTFSIGTVTLVGPDTLIVMPGDIIPLIYTGNDVQGRPIVVTLDMVAEFAQSPPWGNQNTGVRNLQIEYNGYVLTDFIRNSAPVAGVQQPFWTRVELPSFQLTPIPGTVDQIIVVAMGNLLIQGSHLPQVEIFKTVGTAEPLGDFLWLVVDNWPYRLGHSLHNYGWPEADRKNRDLYTGAYLSFLGVGGSYVVTTRGVLADEHNVLFGWHRGNLAINGLELWSMHTTGNAVNARNNRTAEMINDTDMQRIRNFSVVLRRWPYIEGLYVILDNFES